jgi:hypothetical protein
MMVCMGEIAKMTVAAEMALSVLVYNLTRVMRACPYRGENHEPGKDVFGEP